MKKPKDKKGLIVFSLIFGVILIGSYHTWQKEASLSKHRKMTIGKVTDFKYRKKGFIDYQFYVNGELFDTSDPDDAGWPNYIRNAKAQKQHFYFVEYDSTNPYNSKIQIQRKSIGTNTLFKDSIPIKATIEQINSISDSYMDLYISYVYQQGRFKFRTRIHKDSLPCGTVANCEQGEIDLTISKYFPDANNLYFKSYDRMAMKKSKEERR
ncbi:hypothetical protein [Zobellia sp. 1_MG-2023]|uniref:hypothetical protein n=1 Tax=Zobellia sp. 1_MG-2023 TaxID=3062626 RepID=UPI0026E2E65C|nr:hypothetical protein [Zobellia sp. 1_MG-2023]MDO6819493.1 hypothetical protein [Zobellia sp. 1_MG-2023]